MKLSMNVWRMERVLALIFAGLSLSLLPVGAKETNGPMELARQLNQAFIQVADQVSASVVVIKVAHKPNYVEIDEEGNPLWDLLPPEFKKQLREQQEKRKKQEKGASEEPVFDGQGSGVVLREEGYILTNGHVVEGAEKIKVGFKDDSEWYDAVVRGVDTPSDVAVLKMEPKAPPSRRRTADSQDRSIPR